MQRRKIFGMIGASIFGGVLSACGVTGTLPTTNGTPSGMDTANDGSSAVSSEPLSLAVASSLAAVMPALGARYATLYKAPQPLTEAAASSALAQQIVAGAQFDVFVAADMSAMQPLIAANIIAESNIHAIAQTDLVIVTRLDSGLVSITDLTKPGVKIVVADETVPAGRYTTLLLKAIQKRTGENGFVASFTQNVVSYEDKASAVVQKFFAGDVDVAVMYAADLHGHAPTTYSIIPLPKKVQITSTYFAVVLPEAKIGAIEFVNLLTDATNTAVWSEYGFRTIRK
jgi:molybdate transport system substrate-binding protein